ncbi:MAG: polymer-forming cytoskeletal protein [Lachnospiraceae bacterium]|nr:polymer-forming cytoskeletal protein [Candidatus Merdinaster equi]
MEESTLTEAASENVQSVDIPMEEVNDISIGNIDEVVPEVQNEVEDTLLEERNNTMIESHFAENESATDEKSMITEGMTINGDVISKGSLEVLGTITGNLDILGKLDVSGSINGNSRASEIYAENAKIVGEVVSLGSVKIGQSTVIIGNVTATSAVIAGAIKGDIDVKGPVILDTSAIVMGNIKSKSVQINNGAVIEGLCSQCYADVNPSAFFDEFKRTVKA